MDILYCGIITSDNKLKELLEEISSIPFAQSKLEHLILDGFSNDISNKKITVLSTLPVVRYPKYHKIWINEPQEKLYGFKVNYTSFINLPLIKQLTTFISNLYLMIRWAREATIDDAKVILIYGTNPLNSVPAFITRMIFKSRVIAYVTEIDSLRLFDEKNIISRMKNRIYISLSKFVERSFDGYLLLSEHMKEMIDVGHKPTEIIEGMVSASQSIDHLPDLIEDSSDLKSGRKSLIYAGTLNKRYGIQKLVESFIALDDPDHDLVIYGRGDYQSELEKITETRKNIIYMGAQPNNEVISAEKKAKLLINPRPSEEIFTKFSFPSKVLEYMSTGTPCLITRLDGIPEEYYEFCYSYPDETVETMKSTLAEVLRIGDDELQNKGIEAKKFVLENKNNFGQTQKILMFLRENFT